MLGARPRSGDVPEFLSAHELHDTKHRRIAYRAVATSRFREYFRPDLVTPPQALTRESEPVWVDVPSSAPPPPPQLLYAVPLFGWERGGEGRTRTTRRRGGGLRAVPVPAVARLGRRRAARGGAVAGVGVLPGAGGAGPPGHPVGVRPGLRWPAPPPPTPGAQHFTRGVAVGEDLPLLEDPAQRVSVVGHEVEFDAARDLWTCDVELDLGEAYTPFVRLALARYQPSSIAGAHLSAVTTAQIVQVTPERTISPTAASDDPLLLSLAVTGPAHGAAWQTGGVPFPYGSDVEVSVEERDDAIADPDIGWRRVRPAGGAGPRPAHPRRPRPVQRAGPAAGRARTGPAPGGRGGAGTAGGRPGTVLGAGERRRPADVDPRGVRRDVRHLTGGSAAARALVTGSRA